MRDIQEQTLKTVLVIGNSQSVWVKEYVKKIHCALGNKVYLTDYYGLSESEKNYYSDLNVSIIDVHHSNKLLRLIKCRSGLLGFARKNAGSVDLIDIQSPPHSVQTKILESVIRTLNCRTVITFWGSDILRINQKQFDRIRNLLSLSSSINIGTEQMHEALVNFSGSEYEDKCRYVALGSPALDSIAACELSGAECKEKIGLDSSLKTIAVGYNGRVQQQHLKVIEQLASLPQEVKSRTEILVHTGGNIDAAYLEEIKSSLGSSGIPYVVIDKALPLDEVAVLRIATDIFIHAQTTDAFSGSIRECVYAGSVLINPAWIHYDKFDSDGIEYLTYSTFDELPGMVEDFISGNTIIDTKSNSDKVYNRYTWDAVRSQWAELFNAQFN